MRKRTLENYAMKITYLSERQIDWKKPPASTSMVSWTKRTTSGKPIRGSLRTIAHLDRLNRRAYLRYGVGVSVIQPDWNRGVSASAGTHDADSVWDLWIPGVDPWEQQRFFRRRGMAGWIRKPPMFGWHFHGFTLPPREGVSISDDFAVHGLKVGVYVDGGYSSYGRLVASSQIADYYNHAFGLAGMHTPGSDKSWYPRDIEATIFDLSTYINRRVAESS